MRNNNMDTLLQKEIEAWKEIRSTVITEPQKIEGELVINYSAMVKRDEDFLRQSLANCFKIAYNKGYEDAKGGTKNQYANHLEKCSQKEGGSDVGM